MKHSLYFSSHFSGFHVHRSAVARPDAFMRIGLPSTEAYAPLNEAAPFGLDINTQAKVIVKEVLTEEGTEQAREGEYWLDIVYPSILSTVQFTHKPSTTTSKHWCVMRNNWPINTL